MENRVYCLNPVEIVNPQLVDFVLSNEKVYYQDKNGEVHHYTVYPFTKDIKTKELKSIISNRLRKLVKRSSISVFFNEEGVCLDAKIKVPCGHCLLCTEKKKKSFAARCMMECQSHDYLPLFVTLTYMPEDLPDNGSLRYKDVMDFLKRLRINLERQYGYTGEIRYACGSEYGSKTHRPHYHLLIWGFPRTGKLWHFTNVRQFIRQCWKHGFEVTKQCTDSNCGYYVGKYMAKDSYVPKRCAKPVHRTSKNLGVDFVMQTAAPVLRKTPEFTQIQYCDRFDGKVKTLPFVKYFVNKVFPTMTSIPVAERNAYRDYLCGKAEGYEIEGLIDINIPNEYLVDHVYKDTVLDKEKLDEAIYILANRRNVESVDYVANKIARDKYYISLFDNLGDVDLHHKAYLLEKKNAKSKDKEVF